MIYQHTQVSDCYTVNSEDVRLFLTMNEDDWRYCRTNMYEEKPPCFQIGRFCENIWSYFTALIGE